MKKILLSLLLFVYLFGCAPKTFEEKLEGTYKDPFKENVTYVIKKDGTADLIAVIDGEEIVCPMYWLHYDDEKLLMIVFEDDDSLATCFDVEESNNEVVLSILGEKAEKK